MVANFGNRIKELREDKHMLQRQLAAELEIDTPMFSKIERGERRAKREQVHLLASLLQADENALMNLWLADQILDLTSPYGNASDALKTASKLLTQ